jgi:hypothetical protein
MSKWLLSLALLPAAASGALAAPACGQRADVLAQLAQRFEEAPIAVGLADSGALVEVLISDRGATWTIIVSQPNGTSCLVAAGEAWQELQRIASNEVGA